MEWVTETLNSPSRVLFICIAATLVSLVFDGTLIQIWRLNRNIQSFEAKAVRLESDIKLVKTQILKANDPRFLEKEARDRFDLVNEGDLVFVFSESNEQKQ